MKNSNGNIFHLLVITRFKRSEDKVDLSFERSQAAVCLCKKIFIPLMLTIKYDLAKVRLIESKIRIPRKAVELILQR